MAVKKGRMARPSIVNFAAILCVTSVFLSIATSSLAASAPLTHVTEVPRSRLDRLRHGINLSHCFAQSGTYSKKHLDSYTTAEDVALIRTMGSIMHFRSCWLKWFSFPDS
jgi:hypothetical protein